MAWSRCLDIPGPRDATQQMTGVPTLFNIKAIYWKHLYEVVIEPWRVYPHHALPDYMPVAIPSLTGYGRQPLDMSPEGCEGLLTH